MKTIDFRRGVWNELHGLNDEIGTLILGRFHVPSDKKSRQAALLELLRVNPLTPDEIKRISGPKG